MSRWIKRYIVYRPPSVTIYEDDSGLHVVISIDEGDYKVIERNKWLVEKLEEERKRYWKVYRSKVPVKISIITG